jgi:hypothetical protein
MAEAEAASEETERSRQGAQRGSRGARSRARSNGATARSGRPGSSSGGAEPPAEGAPHTGRHVARTALAGGAAVAAVVGGVAIARGGSRKRKRPALPSMGALRATAKALGGAAVEIGKVSYRVGELTSEIRRVREQASQKGD